MHNSDYESLSAKGQSRADTSDPRNITADISDKQHNSFEDTRARVGNVVPTVGVACIFLPAQPYNVLLSLALWDQSTICGIV